MNVKTDNIHVALIDTDIQHCAIFKVILEISSPELKIILHIPSLESRSLTLLLFVQAFLSFLSLQHPQPSN